MLFKKIIFTLSKYNIKVLDHYYSDTKYFILTDFMIISYNIETMIMNISFNISTRPDIAAFFTLVLTDFNEVKDINISEIYMINDGKMLTGDECTEKNQTNIKRTIIDDFLVEQIKLDYLKKVTGGNC